MTETITIFGHQIFTEDFLFFGGLIMGISLYIIHLILDYILDNILSPHRKILSPILGILNVILIFLCALSPAIMILGLILCRQTYTIIMIFGPIVLVASLIRCFFK